MVTAFVTAAALLGPVLPAQGQQTVVTVSAGTVVNPPHDALTALREKYAAAVNAADAAALGALYAADALVVVDDGLILRGNRDIGRYFQEAFAARADGATVTLRPARFTVENDVASETGGFSESRPGEPTPTVTGVYVTIYTRDSGGDWQIAMELRTRGRDKQLVRW
jgi:uncharacterized protein (TIGR02246 family)